MMRSLIVLFLLKASCCFANDYHVEVLDQSVAEGEVSNEIRQQLASTGVRVIRGPSRTMFDLWPLKHCSVKRVFTATSEVLYPFEQGQMVGVVRFRRRNSDFRDRNSEFR